MDLDLEIKEENLTVDTTKCGEILRNLCGQYTFLCFHCGNVYKFAEDLLKHIETHFDHHEPEEPDNFIESLEIEPIPVLKNENQYETDPIEVETFYDIDFDCKAETLDTVGSASNDWKQEKDPIDNFENDVDSNTKCRKSRKSCEPSAKLELPSKSESIDVNNVFSCPICKLTKNCKKDIEKHKTTHNPVNPLNCTICDRTFDKPIKFLNHVQIHENLREYRCTFCELRFNTSRYKNEHEKRCKKFENENNEIPRPKVKIRIKSIATEWEKKLEENQTEYKCDECEKSFETPYLLDYHHKLHDLTKHGNIFECPICTITKTTKDDLEKHGIAHNSANPMVCGICQNLCRKPSELLRHIQIHENLKEYQCSYCEQRFNTYRYKVDHEKRCRKVENWENTKKVSATTIAPKAKFKLKVKTSAAAEIATTELKAEQYQTVYKCDECEKFFETPYLLAYHEKLHDLVDDENIFKCPICTITKKTKDDLEKHGIAHNSANPMVCGICQKLCSKPSQLLDHIQIHENLREYECEHCKQTFNTSRYRYDHEKRCPKNEIADAENFTCDLCGKGFKAKSQLTSHRRRHNTTQTYKCDICGSGFILKENLAKHLERGHGEQSHANRSTYNNAPRKTHTCQICDKFFIKKSNLDAHMASHSNLRLHKCTLCDARFNLQSGLRLHMFVHSTDDKPYKCEICGLKMRLKCNYKSHVMIHKRDGNTKRPHACHLCDKSYFLSNTLKVHIRSHTGERPYQCSECGLTFVSQSKLTHHTKKKHSTGKPFECDLCGRCFTMRYQLRAHMRLQHTQSRNHVCGVCGKRFKVRKYLRQHELLHRPEKKQQCRYCDMKFAQRSALKGHEKSRHLVL